MVYGNEVEAGFRPVNCECCGDSIRSEEDLNHGDEGTFYAGKPLCEGCYCEDEPCATVHYSDGGPEGCGEDYPYVISGTRNETNGDFTVSWHSTDPWRGYYETKSDTYVQLVDDCILSWSEDAEELGKFDGEVRKLLEKLGVGYARVFARTSNVFSGGYDFFARKADLENGKSATLYAALNILKLRYRDPERFRVTALTGKAHVEDFKPEDRLLTEAWSRLLAGEDPAKVQEGIIGKVGRGLVN